MTWVSEMTQEELEDLVLLKQSKFLKPYAKFLIILCKYSSSRSHYTNILKEVVGGSYIIYAKEGILDGYVNYEKGKPPKLTEYGRQLCDALLECWARLRLKEKQKEIGKG